MKKVISFQNNFVLVLTYETTLIKEIFSNDVYLIIVDSYMFCVNFIFLNNFYLKVFWNCTLGGGK